MIRTITKSVLALATAAAVAFVLMGSPAADAQFEPLLGPEIVFDEATSRLYISVTEERSILVFDTTTGNVVEEHFVPGVPAGLDLSLDGEDLYVALNDAGSLHIINLVTGATETVIASPTLDTARAFDVLEISDGRVLLTGNPGSGGFAYVVLVDLNDGTQTRVASNNIIRAAPRLVRAGPDSVLVSEGFSPNSLYLLDLTDPDLPIIAEDNHGNVTGTYYMAASPDGLRAYLPTQIVRTSDIVVVGSPPAPGVPLVTSDGSQLLMAGDQGVSVIDLATLRVIDTFPIDPSCADSEGLGAGLGEFSIRDVAYDESTKTFFTLHDDFVCDTRLVPQCAGLFVTLDMTDLGVTTLVGTPGDDVILGTDAADTIDGSGGNDVICSGAGNDVVVGGDGDDFVIAGAGDDVVRGNAGIDTVFGENGNDRLLGGIDNDVLDGGAGDDFIGGFGGDDEIFGGFGRDRIFGGFGADVIAGDAGDDQISGLIGDDVVQGGDGNDVLNGDRGNDTINGGPGNDVLRGGNANDVLSGDEGDDNISGGKADDQLSGGLGFDTCTGNLHTTGDSADATCEQTFGIE